MIQALIKRNLHVAERRLAYSRAISRRAASSEEGDATSFEEPTLDLATVEQQSLRLINALMVVGLLLVLYWLWQDLFGLLHFMNNITLWEVGDAKGDVPVYLSDLLLSILVLVTMFYPGAEPSGIAGKSRFFHGLTCVRVIVMPLPPCSATPLPGWALSCLWQHWGSAGINCNGW